MHVLYSGRVQGVGFRFTVQRLANQQGCTGWVKNLPNGQVEALIEGRQDDVRQCLDRITQHFSGNITDHQATEAKQENSHSEFEIRFA